MKYQILLLSLVLFSCKNEKTNHNSLEKIEQELIIKEKELSIAKNPELTKPEYNDKKVEIEQINFDDLIGYYVGQFSVKDYRKVKEGGSYVNKINISIDKIFKDSIFGHSVVAGNVRNFKGEFNKEKLLANVKEPGDEKYDGVFKFNLDENELSGIWIANDKTLSVVERKYKLKKRKFEYKPEFNVRISEDYNYKIALSASQEEEGGDLEAVNPKVVHKLNASLYELTNEELENLNKGELEIIRNLIYARHGYSFKNRKMRYFFDSQIDWYIPVSTDVRKELTSVELKNIDLIKRYEQHAERYYDYFGR